MFCRAKDGRDEEKQGRETPTFPSFGAVMEVLFLIIIIIIISFRISNFT